MPPHLVIRGDWREFALYLEPAGGGGPTALVQVFNTLTGVARAAALGTAWLRKLAA